MMKTSLIVIVDRSGSMYKCQSDAEGGLNRLIEDQKKESGETELTLVEFSTDVKCLCRGMPIDEFEGYQLKPRGWTSLLDAVGTTIDEEGERFANMSQSERPDLVLVVIVTDGQENHSREYSFSQIRKIITEQREKYSWQFTFLGADENDFQGTRMGINEGDIASYSTDKMDKLYDVVGWKLGRTRSAVAKGESLEVASFTDQERDLMS